MFGLKLLQNSECETLGFTFTLHVLCDNLWISSIWFELNFVNYLISWSKTCVCTFQLVDAHGKCWFYRRLAIPIVCQAANWGCGRIRNWRTYVVIPKEVTVCLCLLVYGWILDCSMLYDNLYEIANFIQKLYCHRETWGQSYVQVAPILLSLFNNRLKAFDYGIRKVHMECTSIKWLCLNKWHTA